ncbi:MAG: response regulator [Alphaproteobacteria bacterium]
MGSEEENIVRQEKRWSYAALIVISLSLVAISWEFWLDLRAGDYPKKEIILHALVMAEGLMLCVIIVFYIGQYLMTKKLNAEKTEALSMLENRLAAIEASADGIGIVDPDGDLIYMNSALKNLHGITDFDEGEYLNKSWKNLYSENGQIEIDDFVLPHLYEHGYWRGNSSIVRRDGNVLDAELSLTLLPDGSLIGTARDLSEKQKAVEEKKELEQQFYQAQKMEAIGRLAGGIAHDFNNILAAISGYAEFLEEDLPEGSKEQKFARNILKAGSQAKELVDQMLAFSRRKQSTTEAIDIMSPIKESLSMVKASFPKTIEVNSFFNAEHHYIDGNATQISQVLMNLCVNARDAMDEDHGELLVVVDNIDGDDYPNFDFIQDSLPEPSDTPRIKIDETGARKTRLYLGSLAKDYSYIRVKIADTGTGISKAIMERIFEPFFTTKPVDKGTGLGLATVHGVVSSHRGALIIESELGEGTSFEMYFPLVHAGEKAADMDAIDTSQFLEGHILLVEDQDNVREMMIDMLERMGYQVDCCETGLEALTVIKDSFDYYDLVITDHNMPKMTGLEMIQQVHMIDENVPFILLSGYSREKLQDMMKEHPAIKCILRKPVSNKKLREEINKILLQKKKVA